MSQLSVNDVANNMPTATTTEREDMMMTIGEEDNNNNNSNLDPEAEAFVPTLVMASASPYSSSSFFDCNDIMASAASSSSSMFYPNNNNNNGGSNGDTRYYYNTYCDNSFVSSSTIDYGHNANNDDNDTSPYYHHHQYNNHNHNPNHHSVYHPYKKRHSELSSNNNNNNNRIKRQKQQEKKKEEQLRSHVEEEEEQLDQEQGGQGQHEQEVSVDLEMAMSATTAAEELYYQQQHSYNEQMKQHFLEKHFSFNILSTTKEDIHDGDGSDRRDCSNHNNNNHHNHDYDHHYHYDIDNEHPNKKDNNNNNNKKFGSSSRHHWHHPHHNTTAIGTGTCPYSKFWSSTSVKSNYENNNTSCLRNSNSNSTTTATTLPNEKSREVVSQRFSSNWKENENNKDKNKHKDATTIFIPKTKICQFLNNGNCTYGYRCRYRHVDVHCKKPEMYSKITSREQMGLLEPYVTCVLCHDVIPWEDIIAAKHKHFHNTSSSETQTHYDCCKELEWRKKELEKAKTVQCAICLEDAFQNETKCCLLSHCVHVFHIDCIKQWKQIKNNEIDCPLCRTKSTDIIPSRRYIYDEQRKRDYFNQLLKQWSTQPCKHWEKSHECPFGYRCRFGHYDYNGQLISKAEKHKHPIPLEVRRKLMERRQRQQQSLNAFVIDYDDYVEFHLEVSLLLVTLLGGGIFD